MMESKAQILVDLFIYTVPWLFCLLGGVFIYCDTKRLDGKNVVEDNYVIENIARIAKRIALLLIAIAIAIPILLLIAIPMLKLILFISNNLSVSWLDFAQLILIEHVKRFIFFSKCGFVLVDGFFACGFLALYLSLFGRNLRNFFALHFTSTLTQSMPVASSITPCSGSNLYQKRLNWWIVKSS